MKHLLLVLALLPLTGCVALRSELERARQEIAATRTAVQAIEAQSPEQKRRLDDIDRALEGAGGAVDDIEAAIDNLEAGLQTAGGVIGGLTMPELMALLGVAGASVFESKRRVDKLNRDRDMARLARGEATGAAPRPPVS